MATARTSRGMPATGTGGYHPHESPLTMLVPIALLALGAVLAGQIFHGVFVDAGARARILARQRRLQPSIWPHAAHDVAAVGQADADDRRC